MNKNVAIIIVGVMVLGMGLITYNEYTNPDIRPYTSSEAKEEKKTEEVQTKSEAEPATPAPPAVQEEPAQNPEEKQTPPMPEKTEEVATPEKTEQVTAPEANPPMPEVQAEERAPAYESAPVAPAAKSEASAAASAKEEQTPPKKSSAQELVIKKITVATIGDGVTVRIDSNKRPQYTSLRLSSPDRIVLDLKGNWKLRAPGVPKNKFVSNVRVGQHKSGTRIVIDLHTVPGSVRYLKHGDHGLDVRMR